MRESENEVIKSPAVRRLSQMQQSADVPFRWLTPTANSNNRRRMSENGTQQRSLPIPLPDSSTLSESPPFISGSPSMRIQLWEPGLPRSSCSHYVPWEETAQSHSLNQSFSPSFSPSSEDVRNLSPIRQCRSLSSSAIMGPVSRYQIVLYRDSRMVVYNLDSRRIEARALSPVEENTIRAHRMSQCPMCGQVIDPAKFSFQAQSYFRILQDLLRTRFSPPSSAEFTPSDTPLSERKRGLSDAGYPSVLSAIDNQQANPFVELSKTSTPSGENEDAEIPIPKNLSKGMFVTGYYNNFFREIRGLGTGSFGQVFLCHHFLDDVYLGEYAMKKVPVGDDKAWLQKMLREVKIRERLHNANIVEYKHSWLEVNLCDIQMHRTAANLPIIPWLFMLMEYCNGGDLETLLESNRYISPVSNTSMKRPPLSEQSIFPMKESHIWKLFFDIANGLNHLHHSGILHRDLKPQNILLQCTLDTLTNQPTTSALLADFGTSELFTERVRHARRHGFTGTVEFTAPELLETDEMGHFRDDYDEKSDVWSLGVVLFVLAYGRVPYCHDDPKGCRLKILRHTNPRLIIPSSPQRSADLVLLIEALLQRDPDARPSIDAVVTHKRIQKRLSDTEALSEAGREISYLLSFFRGANVSDDMPTNLSTAQQPRSPVNDPLPPSLLGSDTTIQDQ